jgi:hypothetical protein
MTPEEEAIFERAQELKRQSQQVCLFLRQLLLPSSASWLDHRTQHAFVL